MSIEDSLSERPFARLFRLCRAKGWEVQLPSFTHPESGQPVVVVHVLDGGRGFSRNVQSYESVDGCAAIVLAALESAHVL